LVLLELALIQFGINELIKEGFTIVTTPELVKKQLVESCGFLVNFQNNVAKRRTYSNLFN
jgi:seryl-tRNA synthetase